MANLATLDQLSAYLGETLPANDPSGLLMLQIASGMVRDYLHQDIDYKANEVVTLDPLNGSYVLLPQLPVVDVTKLEIYVDGAWSIVASGFYTVSRAMGMIAGKPGNGIDFPSDPETWRVTYSHGYETVPDTIIGVVCGVAARAYTEPTSVSSESLGGYSVSYQMHEGGFSPIEKAALSRFHILRVA